VRSGEAVDDELPDLDSALAIREAVWGKGYVKPGGKDAILSLAGPAELGEDSPVLVLGAGLGEGAMAVAGEWLANVEGLVDAGPTAEKATARIAARGMSDTVSVTSYMPQNARLKVNQYRCVLARESFFDLMAKQTLLEKIWNALKEDSHFLFSDLVYATEAAAQDPVIEEWCDKELRMPDCWTMEQYDETLTGFGFVIKSTEDESDWYYGLVKAKWLEFMDTLGGKNIERKYIDLVMDEAQLWQSRMKAIKSGHLRYVRVHAYRRLDKDIK